MATDFPTQIDTFVNPTAADRLSTTGVIHHEQHTDENDAIVAIETYLGIRGSTSTGSITYQVNQLTTIVGTGTSSAGVSDDQRLVLATHTGLTNERTYALGAGLSGTDGGAKQPFTTRIYPTGVVSGTYHLNGGNPAVTVNAQGQITFISTSGDSSGFVTGLPLAPRFAASIWYSDYVGTTDRIYVTSKIATGSWYYIDRTMDAPVQLAVFSGRTPNAWVYSTILTGVVIGNGTNAAFAATLTGGILLTGITALGMEGGAVVRTAFSGKTIYAGNRANSEVDVWRPDTQASVITGIAVGNAPGDGGRALAYVSGVDSVFVAVVNSDIAQIDCTTNTLAYTHSGVGLNLGSTASLTYNAPANKIFMCGGNSAATMTWYITPGVQAAATQLAFPAGFHGTFASHCYSLGNYVYFCSNATSPPLVLVLDAVNLVWKRPLTVAENNSTIGLDRGSLMTGIASEGVLYIGTAISTSVGFYVYGRA